MNAPHTVACDGSVEIGVAGFGWVGGREGMAAGGNGSGVNLLLSKVS